MKVSEYFVNFLVENNITDVFGVPGGVVLDLLCAFANRDEINVHLSYNEQAAALEACGYSQYAHQVSIAYATRGPGFTNMITGIAEAYSESLPVIFITAHASSNTQKEVRFIEDQEISSVEMVSKITKYAKSIDSVSEVCNAVCTAYREAVTDRKGPVFLDFSAELWNEDVIEKKVNSEEKITEYFFVDIKNKILQKIQDSKRPLILVGDGVNQGNCLKDFVVFADTIKVPVLSSRASQDVGAKCKNYYGYIGSHGLRYSNFIFAKADFVLVIGNRLSFPAKSKSYNKALQNKQVIYLDIDNAELYKPLKNTRGYLCEIKKFLQYINNYKIVVECHKWLNICKKLQQVLKQQDTNDVIEKIEKLLIDIDDRNTVCCDVGNNEFWVSKAYANTGINNRILYSKSFGVLGCSLPKAIGAYYASKEPVVCFMGDQGFQFNMQELQVVAQNNLPIKCIVINDKSSGMIRDRQYARYGYCIHSTLESGYGVPDIQALCSAYGIAYYEFDEYQKAKSGKKNGKLPMVIELDINEILTLRPCLTVGNDIQDMSPAIDSKLYRELNNL